MVSSLWKEENCTAGKFCNVDFWPHKYAFGYKSSERKSFYKYRKDTQQGDSKTFNLYLKPFGVFQLGLTITSNNLFHQLPFALLALLHTNCSPRSLLLLFVELMELWRVEPGHKQTLSTKVRAAMGVS